MSKAWRTNGALHVECEACGSSGVPGGSHTRHDVEASVQARRAENDRKIALLRADFTSKHTELTSLATRKRITPQLFAERQKELHADFTAQATKRVADAPKPGDGFTETLDACPWCAAKMGVAVTVEA